MSESKPLFNRYSLSFLFVVLLVTLLQPLGYAASADQANLLKNAGFEEVNEGDPTFWRQVTYTNNESDTEFAVDYSQAYEGSYSGSITNIADNHARWIQTVPVKPDRVYQLSGFVKTEAPIVSGTGAHLFVEGVAVQYPEVKDSEGEWRYLELYGKTGSKQTELAVGASLGGYGAVTSGKAWFDELSMREIDAAPEGVEVYSFDSTPVEKVKDEPPVAKRIEVSSFVAIACLFVVLFAIVYRFMLRKNDDFTGLTEHSVVYHAPPRHLVGLGIVVVLALALRCVLALTQPGYENDIALFMYWSDQVVQNGISGFYGADIFVDYPPGYIYILYVVGIFKQALGIKAGTASALLLYKLPAILADHIAAGFVYWIARRKFGLAASMGLAIVYLFNPAVIIDSAVWGQVDALFALVLVLTIQSLADNRIRGASIWFAIAALIKPQAFIFMPVLLFALLIRRSWRQVGVSALYGFGTFLLLSLPFFWRNGWLKGIIDLYSSTLSSYPYATLNSFNVYVLGLENWQDITKADWLLSYDKWGMVGVVLAVALAAYGAIRGRVDGSQDRSLLISILVAIGGFLLLSTWSMSNDSMLLSYGSIALALLVIGIGCYFAIRGKKIDVSDRSFIVAAIIIVVVYLFVTKMHERYMFPVLLLSLLAYIQTKDRRLLHIFVGFTFTNFVNIAMVLAFSKTTTYVPITAIPYICALVNVGLLIYLLYMTYDIYVNKRVKEVRPYTEEDLQIADSEALVEIAKAPDNHRYWQRKDWFVMGAITLVYGVVALINLGSFEAPQTVWQPQKNNQSFYVDLGETKHLQKSISFGGAGSGEYRLEFATEQGQWTSGQDVVSNHVSVFAWNAQQLDVEARYVRLVVKKSGFSMHELAFFEKDSQEPLPILAIHAEEAAEAKRGKVEALFDEQDKVLYTHNFMKGSYFDEIYHARTAHEHLEGIVAYENTHPPLGKIFIAIGIKLFGVTPFGWRIVGTLFGVAMLPVMYAIGRRLFKSTLWAGAATLLLAADFMHFVQTRIATIDVYGVFFIMLMFYFMHRYTSMNFHRDGLKKTMLPLFMAGLIFGLGVASKWIVLYGGAGLAFMLGLSLLDRFREYLAAKRALQKGVWIEKLDEAALKQVIYRFPRYTIATLLSCLVFYIVIPAGIYALSYIPVLTVMKDGYTLQSLIAYQKNMFSYHSNLVSSHPFSSPWWQWPYMVRPVWYYSGGGLAEGMKSTIVTMGNPLIWWSGMVAIVATLLLTIRSRQKHFYVIWIAYLSQYIPWMLVTRETFLYHYFAMVPFMILSIIYMLRRIEKARPELSYLRYILLIGSVLLFVLFYPALSGLEVPTWYITLLRWLPSWVF